MVTTGYVPIIDDPEQHSSGKQQSLSQLQCLSKCVVSRAMAILCLTWIGMYLFSQCVASHKSGAEATVRKNSVLAESHNHATENFGQVLWDVLVDPQGSYGKLRNDVVTSRVTAGLSSAVFTYVATTVCTFEARSSPDDEIADKRWASLEANERARLEIGQIDIGLLLKRYKKGRIAAALSAVVRLILGHLLPCYLVFTICRAVQSPGWYSWIFRAYMYIYYSLYCVATMALFLWSAVKDRLIFCVAFVLPVSAVFGLGGQTEDPTCGGLWVAAQADGVANQVMTILCLIFWAPPLIALQWGQALGMAESCDLIGQILLLCDGIIAVLALIGLVISLVQHTLSFWFLVAIFSAAPGVLFLFPLLAFKEFVIHPLFNS